MEFYDFPFSWEFHHPNWLSYCSEGLKPPTRYMFKGEDITVQWSLVDPSHRLPTTRNADVNKHIFNLQKHVENGKVADGRDYKIALPIMAGSTRLILANQTPRNWDEGRFTWQFWGGVRHGKTGMGLWDVKKTINSVRETLMDMVMDSFRSTIRYNDQWHSGEILWMGQRNPVFTS